MNNWPTQWWEPGCEEVEEWNESEAADYAEEELPFD